MRLPLRLTQCILPITQFMQYAFQLAFAVIRRIAFHEARLLARAGYKAVCKAGLIIVRGELIRRFWLRGAFAIVFPCDGALNLLGDLANRFFLQRLLAEIDAGFARYAGGLPNRGEGQLLRAR
jgi:hypothetical protein